LQFNGILPLGGLTSPARRSYGKRDACPTFKDEATVKRLTQRPQRTIARVAELSGAGFITGKHVHLRFVPAPADTGVVFIRTDLGRDARIPARVEYVTGTQRRTTLGQAPLCVGLVEHVLAALHGLHLDNCFVELNAPEPPGLDGSAKGFVLALQSAGAVALAEKRDIWMPSRTVLIEAGEATLALHPTDGPGLRVSYILDYGPRSPIVRQVYTEDVAPETFAKNIAPCRTFLLEEEAHLLREQGIGSKTKMSDLLVFGPRGPIDNALRFGNEPARHKVLDILGDLSLFGHDLCGHLVAYRSGHPLNVALAKSLRNRLAPVMPRQRAAA
jgi:UDP-3-O-[3-hydroxymyristoyl] N-acetylglucosamine deacetylase